MTAKPEQSGKKKRGFWAAIWEAMTKTGGCCGGGGNCCGPAQPQPEKKTTARTEAKDSRCCG